MIARDQARLDEHAAMFNVLESMAAERSLAGQDDEAAALCQLAASYAWRNHPGFFASRSLEDTLDRVASRSVEQRPTFGHRSVVRHVLHVMTRSYAIGGHTRVVQRWAALDSSRAHSLAMTSARPFLSDYLQSAIWDSGGAVYCLGAVHRRIPDRARALRDLAEDFDAVIVHVHPFDVLPSLAFGRDSSVPVALLNHADHVFWIGGRAADRILNLRTAGAELCVRARGIDPADNLVLPIPLGKVERREERDAAKHRIGVPAHEVLIVTMARPEKYTPINNVGFLDVVAPAVLENDHLRLLAIGPTAQGAWSTVEIETRGRIRAIGSQLDPSAYLDAADLYIDSFPFSSVTSMLEAGARGTPLVAYTPPRPGADVFGPDDPAVQENLVSASSAAELVSEIMTLASSRERRSDIGKAQQRTIHACHSGDSWQLQCEATYDSLLNRVAEDRMADSPRTNCYEPTLLDDLLIELYGTTSLARVAEAQCRVLGRGKLPLLGGRSEKFERLVRESCEAPSRDGGARPLTSRAEHDAMPICDAIRGPGRVELLLSTAMYRVALGRSGQLTKGRERVLSLVKRSKRALSARSTRVRRWFRSSAPRPLPKAGGD
jgi:hypothetical protein